MKIERNGVLEPAQTDEEKKRIVILSDTHDAAFAAEKADDIRKLEGDINIAIGDVYDSEIRNKLTSDFKVDPEGSVASLNEQERLVFDRLVKEGLFPLRAFWRAKIETNPELLRDIVVELDDQYDLFVKGFSKLPNAKWLYGNLELGYKNTPDFKNLRLNQERPENLETVQDPEIFFEDDQNVGILFPSLPKNEKTKQAVDDFLIQALAKIEAKPDLKNVIFIAHEYPFKGLPPQRFKERMSEAGIDKFYIPFYLPNEYRKEILDFIFQVPEGAQVKFIYGHIHDPKETTQAGVPFKDTADKDGMKWAVNKKDPVTGQRRTRQFDMYQMPFKSTYIIDIKGSDITVEPQNNPKHG